MAGRKHVGARQRRGPPHPTLSLRWGRGQSEGGSRRSGKSSMSPTYFLGIETSCDETAAAVFTDEPRILASVVASQTDLHMRFGGVVPEVAARAHLQRLLPVIDEALRQSGVRLDQISCVAVHNRPGLVGALLVGVSAA